MHIEEDELISIIGNLVDNAFQAFEQENNKDKIIEISSFKRQEKIYINISNNGDMIPKEVKNKIFNKGFSTKKKESADHGYGLYITKQLVEKNNGNIRVESSEDKTEFIIEFSVDSNL